MSRKPTRPGDRDGDAGRGDEYDDYDLYAPDGYQSKDDGWSPGEYFSPEGIKGRWAGEHPDGRAGGRGRREDGQPGESPPGDRNPGYGADEYATGAYELPAGTDGERPERGRRRRRDREDRTDSWTAILRLRRDRGEDIWPDDGVSDEDYWASVASDQPLNGSGAPPPPSGAAPRPGSAARAAAAAGESRFGDDQRGPDQRGPDQRGPDQRGGAGRLGSPPGLAADYQAGAGGASGRASGRPATGPHAIRANTGPGPTVGVTVSRPPTGPSSTQPGTAGNRSSGPNAGWPGAAPPRRGGGPGPGSGGFPQQPATRPSFQPNAPQAAGPPAGSRQPDPGDWGDRTERIERVNASGYPDRRDTDRDTGGIWSIPGRDPGAARNGEDDPLTSAAYSRAKLGETDGRSYRTAARRSEAQTQLTDQTESFFAHQYPGGQYQAGHTGAFDYPGTQPAEQRTTEFRQYRGDAPAAAASPPAPGGRYPAVYGDQPKYPAPPGRSQPAPGQQAPGQGNGPAQVSQPGRGPGASRRPGTPGSGPPSGQYESQHARPPQPPRPQAQPPAGPLGAPVYSNGSATAAGASPSGAAPSNPYDSATTGSYPYPGQSYPARPGGAGPAGPPPGGQAGPGRDAADSRYYRPEPPPGQAGGAPQPGPRPAGAPPHRAAQDRDDQGRDGYGNRPPAPRDRPY